MYTILEVAEKLKVHPVTVRRYVQDRKIEHLKVGKSVRFSQEHLDNFIKSCTVNTEPNGGENAI